MLSNIFVCELLCAWLWDKFCGIIIEGEGQVNLTLMILKWFVTHCVLSYTVVERRVFKFVICLKVGGNEKQGGSGRSQMLGNGLGPWRSRFIYNLNMQLLNKIIFPFPLSPSKWISDYLDIKRCRTNNLARAHQSSLRQWRCGQNSQRKLWTRFELGPRLFLRFEHSVRK